MQDLEKKVIELKKEIEMRKEMSDDFRKRVGDDIADIKADLKKMPEYWQSALTAHSVVLKEEIRSLNTKLESIKKDYVCGQELKADYYDKKEVDLELQPIKTYLKTQKKFLWLLITSIIGNFGAVIGIIYFLSNLK